MIKQIILIIAIISLAKTNTTFYPKTEDASICNGFCYFESGCMPGTECMTLIMDTAWYNRTSSYTECEESLASYLLEDSEWETIFQKEKACKLKIAQEETNEAMKKVQTCQAGCLDKVLENKAKATCLSDSSCFANQKRCADQCTSDNSCPYYTCYGGQLVFDDEIIPQNEYCSALKEKNDGYLNIYEPMEPTHLHLYFKCIEFLNSRPELTEAVQNTQNCWKTCSDTMKTAINYDPSNPEHTKIEQQIQQKEDVINALYPTPAALGLCFNSCSEKTECDETCHTQMQAPAFTQLYAGISECLSFGIKSQSISQDNWQEVLELYKTCLSKMAEKIEDPKIKATQICYSSCVTNMITWFTEQTCTSSETCFFQHSNCMDTCEDTNNCPDSDCFGEQDFGQAISVDAECKKVMDQTRAIENPYQAVNATLMDAYSGCLSHIRTKYSNAARDPTINCWGECIDKTNNNIDNSSLILSLSSVLVVVLVILI